MEMYTGTVELKDEVIPDDEDEDISIQTRGKSTMTVTITIGDGKEAPKAGSKVADTDGEKPNIMIEAHSPDEESDTGEIVVFQEEDLGDNVQDSHDYRDED